MSKQNTVETAEDEMDELLPDGWTGADDADIFDPDTWGGLDTDADAHEDDEADGEGNPAGEEEEDDSTTVEESDSQTDPETGNDDSTTVDDDGSGKLHFQANVDHVTQDVELDPADLPTIYQKSLVLDRYQKRVSDLEAELAQWDSLASGLKYDSRDALRESLFEGAIQDFISDHPSVPEEMARDYITRQFQGVKPVTKQEEQPAEKSGRDFKAEVADLFRAYPGARTEKIPDEVTNDALTMGKPLVQAYADWKARTSSAKATRAERENKILKQNQAAAAKAPVSKVTGGGKTDTNPMDDFLRGFNEDSAWT